MRISVALFNRATYIRNLSLLHRLHRDVAAYDLRLIISPLLLKDKFGNHEDAIENVGFNFSVLNSLDYNVNESTKMHLISANILKEMGELLSVIQPDCGIVIGDRFETLAAAMAYSFHNIPLFHIQGGERSGNIDEKIRHSVTKLSDYHFTCTDVAYRRVLLLGEDPSRVWNAGCPSIDLIKFNNVKRRVVEDKFIIVMFHPHTKEKESLTAQMDILIKAIENFLNKNEKYECFFFHPNEDPGKNNILNLLDNFNHPRVKKFGNISGIDFLRKLSRCRCIIGNSSAGLREASYLGVPAINIGNRQEGREKWLNCLDVDFDVTKIEEAIYYQSNICAYKKSSLYGTGEASIVISSILYKKNLSIKGPINHGKESINAIKRIVESQKRDQQRRTRSSEI